MKKLAYVVSVLGSILVAGGCGGSGAAPNDGSAGKAGSAAAAGAGAGAGAGSTSSAGAGGTQGAAGAGGSAAGSGGAAGGTDCSTATTPAACAALPDCHAVYTAEPRTPVGTCTCPDFGCCSTFAFCAAGAHATCTGTVLCKVAAPYCEPTYSVANNGSCYEGCVMSSVCAP